MRETDYNCKLPVDALFLVGNETLSSNETLFGIDPSGRVVPFLNTGLSGFRGEGEVYDAVREGGRKYRCLVRLEASPVPQDGVRGNLPLEKTHRSSVIGWMVIATDLFGLPHVFGASHESQQYDRSGLHPHRSFEEAERCLYSFAGSNTFCQETLMFWSLHFI